MACVCLVLYVHQTDASILQYTICALLICTACSNVVRCRRASLALAVGCIYRSKGGMSLQLGVANAVASLTAVSQACKGAVQLWILHGLCLTANAAGLAYVPYCKVSQPMLCSGPRVSPSLLQSMYSLTCYLINYLMLYVPLASHLQLMQG